MKINLHKYLEYESDTIKFIFLKLGWNHQDLMWASKEFAGKEILLSCYPDLLGYTYVYRPGAYGVYGPGEKEDKRVSEEHLIPWIACSFELEGIYTTKWHMDVLKELKDWLKDNFPLKPFYDEDAKCGIYRMTTSIYTPEWTRYNFYVNPDFPNGWWENHTL